MAFERTVAEMTTEQLISAANGRYGSGIASDGLIKEAAAELKRRSSPAGSAANPPDQISADAHFIATNASRDAGRIIKHLWIIFVLLPFVCGILFWILMEAAK